MAFDSSSSRFLQLQPLLASSNVFLVTSYAQKVNNLRNILVSAFMMFSCTSVHFSLNSVNILNPHLDTTPLKCYKSGMNLVYFIKVFAKFMVCRLFNPIFPQLKKFWYLIGIVQKPLSCSFSPYLVLLQSLLITAKFKLLKDTETVCEQKHIPCCFCVVEASRANQNHVCWVSYKHVQNNHYPEGFAVR